MNKNQYTQRLAESLAYIGVNENPFGIAEEIMEGWLWEQIDADAREAQQRVRDYSYGGTFRHPLDMD